MPSHKIGISCAHKFNCNRIFSSSLSTKHPGFAERGKCAKYEKCD